MPSSPPTTPSVVLDASTLVGALLKRDSTPGDAFSLARTRGSLALSAAVEAELRDVLSRPKFRRYLDPGDAEAFWTLIEGVARRVVPTTTVTDCRDPKDNKYLELALAAGADTIVSSDRDLLVLDPWRGMRIVTPAEYVRRFGAAG